MSIEFRSANRSENDDQFFSVPSVDDTQGAETRSLLSKKRKRTGRVDLTEVAGTYARTGEYAAIGPAYLKCKVRAKRII